MAYERLSAQDAVFLELEQANAPMHVGAVALFGASSVQSEDGTIDIDAVRALVSSRLPRLPRYRMRLAWTPVSGAPVWVDDHHFDLRYHIRHVRLPRGGSAAAFDELASAFLTQKLDRDRPLWEILVCDGLQGGRIGAVFKAHHALIDGVSGVDMMILLLSTEPCVDVPTPPRWEPRPVPTGRALLEAEIGSRAQIPLSVLAALRGAAANPALAAAQVRNRALGVGQLLQLAFQGGSETPLNAATGPNRRLATLRMELDAVKRVKKHLGGTVNDAAIAIVTGALRRFFEMRGLDPDGMRVRMMIPASTRTDVERGTLGNKLAALAAEVPVYEADPRKRYEKARQAMDALKTSKVALGNEVLMGLAEWTSPQVLAAALRVAMRLRSVHVMVTNMRGPTAPLYFLDAPLLEVYPSAPLWPGQSVTIGLMSYRDQLYWGIAVDPDSFTDADDLVDALRSEVQALGKLAVESASAGAAKRRA